MPDHPAPGLPALEAHPRRQVRASLLALGFCLSAGVAMPDSHPIAFSCTADASLPPGSRATLCDSAAETLAARYPARGFTAWDGSGTPPEFLQLSLSNWRKTGLALQISWATPAFATPQQTRRNFSISDKTLTEKLATGFIRRILAQIDFAF